MQPRLDFGALTGNHSTVAEFVDLPARGEYTAARHNGCELLVADSWYPAALHVPRHAHRGATITAVVAGSLREIYPMYAEDCSYGMVVVRPAGAPHADVISAGGVRDIEIDLAPSMIEDAGFGRWFEDLRHLRDARLGFLASQLARELSIHDSIRPLAVEGIAMELIALTARLFGARQLQPGPPAWLSRARDLVHAHFRETLSIHTIARAADVHPVYLARAFRKHYGVTPSVLIRQLRIRWAADQIQSSTKTFGDIAADAGFYDQAHFTRLFRREIGMTPSQFKKQVRASK